MYLSILNTINFKLNEINKLFLKYGYDSIFKIYNNIYIND